jgi:putative addiction module component (TIGR02574 family)
MSKDELREAALRLPREQRADLARTLLRSLEEGSDADAASAWVEELTRRAHEVADGTAKLVDWETARERIAARLKARREARTPR